MKIKFDDLLFEILGYLVIKNLHPKVGSVVQLWGADQKLAFYRKLEISILKELLTKFLFLHQSVYD